MHHFRTLTASLLSSLAPPGRTDQEIPIVSGSGSRLKIASWSVSCSRKLVRSLQSIASRYFRGRASGPGCRMLDAKLKSLRGGVRSTRTDGSVRTAGAGESELLTSGSTTLCLLSGGPSNACGCCCFLLPIAGKQAAPHRSVCNADASGNVHLT